MISDDDYDYERIQNDFRRRSHPKSKDHSWAKGLVLGIVLGVMLCTGTTYAIYAGELAYESTMQFESPAPHAESLALPLPRTDEARPADPRPNGGGPRPRRGWSHSRGAE